MKRQPPKFPFRLFRWFCDPQLVDGIEGDLHELHSERSKVSGRRYADFRLYTDVVALFRPGIIRQFDIDQKLINGDMYRNYLSVGDQR